MSLDRMLDHARKWAVVIDNTLETETSVIGFGSREVGELKNQSVVLKVIRREGDDEWQSGAILQAFGGDGVARVYEHGPGAVLLERLRPGNSLAEMSISGRDAEATDILAKVIEQMTISSPDALRVCPQVPTVWDWAKGFERYITTGDAQIPKQLVESAQRLYLKLCASQRKPRLLHGDLQHYNVLFDAERGWLAIDPKGVIGEVEYEIGAILRNPFERPDLFTSRNSVETRIKQLTERLHLEYERVLAWGFAQAVLSAIWVVEDGFKLDPMNPGIRLANVMQPMLPATPFNRDLT